MKPSKIKILVTGSEGFIGSHLMKVLGDSGIGYDKKDGWDILDIKDLEEKVKSNKPSVIVHLAAISNQKDFAKNPQLGLETNLIGTLNVLQIAEKYNIRTILASSAAVEGDSGYGVSKRLMEELAGVYENIVILRLFNVYGKGSKSVVNKFYKAIKNGKKVHLNGNTSRDYIYVGDVVNTIIDFALHEKEEGTYEVGTGVSTSLIRLVRLIEKKLHKKAIIEKGKKVDEIQHSLSTRTLSYLTPLEKGIEFL